PVTHSRLDPRLRKVPNPPLNLLPQLLDLGDTLPLAKVLLERLDGIRVLDAPRLRILARLLRDGERNLNRPVDNVGDALKVPGREAPRRHGGRAQPQTTGLERRDVAGDGV